MEAIPLVSGMHQDAQQLEIVSPYPADALTGQHLYLKVLVAASVAQPQ